MSSEPVTGFGSLAFFVLGMHRSGTSALSRCLNLIGLRQPGDIIPANKGNPLGYWESWRMVRFNDRVLDDFGVHWTDPDPMPEGWADDSRVAARVGEAEAILIDDFGRVGGVALKDPRLSRVMPVWRQAVLRCGAEPVCLIACRNPLEVCRSLKARDGMDNEHALALWQAYMLDAELGSRGLRRAVVPFAAMVSDWRTTLRAALAAVGVSDALRADASGDSIDGFVDPQQRHHRTSHTQFLENEDIGRDLKETYQLFVGDDPFGEPETFDRLRRRWREKWERGRAGAGRAGRSRRRGDTTAPSGNVRSVEENTAEFHHDLGNRLASAGHLDDAEAAHRRAIALDPNQSRCHRALGEVLVRRERINEAIIAFETAIALNPDEPSLHHKLGNLLSRAGRFEDAETAQRRAVGLNPRQPWHYRALGTVLDQLGRATEAIGPMAKAIELNPCGPHLRFRLAELLSETGRFEEGVRVRTMAEAMVREGLGLGAQWPRVSDGTDATHRTAVGSGENLLRLLASLSARRWAGDVDQLLRDGRETADGSQEWPLGNRSPVHDAVPVAAHGATEGAPRLSVMIPVHDCERESWLHECLESVRAEVRGSDAAEIVVVDDASATPAAQMIAERHGPDVTYRRNARNLGLVGNHNFCLAAATGEFVHILHQDDRVEPGFYQALVDPLMGDENLVAAFSNVWVVDADSRRKHRAPLELARPGPLDDLLERLCLRQRVYFPSIILRRRACQSSGGFSPSLRFAFDWEMWGRLAAQGPVWYEPRPLASYRAHEASATHSFSHAERLVDDFRTIVRLLRLVPPANRTHVAEAAFQFYLMRYWRIVTNTRTALGAAAHDELKAFLLRPWADDVQVRVRTALQRFQPRDGEP